MNTTGMINLGAALNDAMFRSPIERAVGGRTPTAHIETMNRFLREQAWRQYGSKVDAVINVTYQTEHDGDVYASGLAVQFLEPQGGSPSSPLVPNRTTEDRLKELQSLQEKGLLTPREYEQKRQEILKGL